MLALLLSLPVIRLRSASRHHVVAGSCGTRSCGLWGGCVGGVGSGWVVIDLDTELLYVHPDSPNGGLWEQGESRAVYPMVMKLSGDDWKVINWPPESSPSQAFLLLFSRLVENCRPRGHCM